MPSGCYGAQRRDPQPSKGGTAGEGTVTFYLEIGLIQILTPHSGAEFSCASVFPSVQWV